MWICVLHHIPTLASHAACMVTLALDALSRRWMITEAARPGHKIGTSTYYWIGWTPANKRDMTSFYNLLDSFISIPTKVWCGPLNGSKTNGNMGFDLKPNVYVNLLYPLYWGKESSNDFKSPKLLSCIRWLLNIILIKGIF